MSVIQTIRDKGGLISAILIAIALLGFILMDAFTGRSNIFGGNSTVLGTVNGNKIDYIEFNKKYLAEQDARQKQGYPMNDQSRQQLNESLWNQEVSKILADKEFDELGIKVGKNEVNDILFGKNPPADLRQGFTDPKTNVYNADQARQYFAQIKKSKNASERQQLSAYVNSVEYTRMMEKYASLLNNSVNIPKWFVEKQNIENSQLARISYVKIPYTSIADSSVKVTDEEIEDYVKKHVDDFKQDQESRSVEYILFNASASHADSIAVKDKLEELKEEFKQTTDIKSFLIKAGSESPYYDGFINAKVIQQSNKDSILKQPVGSVYGPYSDGNTYAISKILGVKLWPDTVKVRHILIGTTQQNQQGQMMTIREDSAAKKLADSVQTAIKNGANFDTLCVKYSDDQGSKEKGGVYDNVYSGQMTPPFNDYIFDHKPGESAVVKTDFGYHYVEILSQKGNNSPAYKVAYVSKAIFPSSTTDDSVSNAASQFAGDSRDEKTFDTNYEKNLKSKGINKFLADNIKPNDFTIGQSFPAASRQLVKAIFTANKGEVLSPVKVEDNYVVAVVTDVSKPGIQSASRARQVVEPLLLKEKKAQQIIQKIGKINTLEDVASKTSQTVQVTDSLRINGGRNFSYEPRVIGATFNPANKGKIISEGIEGSEGVFAVRVDDVSATSVANANIEDQRKQLELQIKQYQLSSGQRQNLPYPLNILHTGAKVKDNRSKFF